MCSFACSHLFPEAGFAMKRALRLRNSAATLGGSGIESGSSRIEFQSSSTSCNRSATGSRSREVLKHPLDCFGRHARCTWRSFQQQGAVWPLYKPRPSRGLLDWAEARGEEADQFLFLLRWQRL